MGFKGTCTRRSRALSTGGAHVRPFMETDSSIRAARRGGLRFVPEEIPFWKTRYGGVCSRAAIRGRDLCRGRTRPSCLSRCATPMIAAARGRAALEVHTVSRCWRSGVQRVAQDTARLEKRGSGARRAAAYARGCMIAVTDLSSGAARSGDRRQGLVQAAAGAAAPTCGAAPACRDPVAGASVATEYRRTGRSTFGCHCSASPRGLVVTLRQHDVRAGQRAVAAGRTYNLQKLAAYLTTHRNRTIAIEETTRIRRVAAILNSDCRNSGRWPSRRRLSTHGHRLAPHDRARLRCRLSGRERYHAGRLGR